MRKQICSSKQVLLFSSMGDAAVAFFFWGWRPVVNDPSDGFGGGVWTAQSNSNPVSPIGIVQMVFQLKELQAGINF